MNLLPPAGNALALALTLFAFSLVAANGAVISYDEGVDGPLSTDHLNPTPLGTMDIGINTVSGSVSNARNASATTDVFTFDIASGTRLDSIIVTSFSSSTSLAFTGLNTGTSFPYDAAGLDALTGGYAAIGAATFSNGTVLFDESSNALSQLATIFGSTGFTAPLGAGTYTIYVQETNANPSNYTFSFAVSPVPEPSRAILLGAGTLLAALRRRRFPL